MTKKINNLDVGIVIETDLDILFYEKNLSRNWSTSVMKRSNASMHGVGIVLGIVEGGYLRCPLARAERRSAD